MGGCALLCVAAGCGPWPSDGALESEVFSGVRVIGGRGTAPGQFVKPRSIAVDRNDNVYVCDMTGRIQKFDPDGNYLLQWQMPEITRGRPKGMACDHEGNIVVVEPHYSRINHFTPEGRLVSQWGVHGRGRGQLSFPRAVAIAPDGSAFVSEFQIVERLQKFGPGRESVMVEIRGAGRGPREFNRAEGLSLSPSGELFVADSCNHRVQVFRTDGTFVREFGRAGSGPGEFSYPYDVRVDGLGLQFVCEFGNSRLTVLDADDRVLEIIGSAGSAPGRFNNPWSLALDSHGNLYVADSQNHRVQKLIRREPVAEVQVSSLKFQADRTWPSGVGRVAGGGVEGSTRASRVDSGAPPESCSENEQLGPWAGRPRRHAGALALPKTWPLLDCIQRFTPSPCPLPHGGRGYFGPLGQAEVELSRERYQSSLPS